jgi:putative ABC transport system permease protein
MDTLPQDLRYAVRTLRHAPGMTLAILSIGLAIGANATIFTWLDGLVLHPLPDPATLVTIALLLAFAALAACYVPARRAARIDPMVALRHE